MSGADSRARSSGGQAAFFDFGGVTEARSLIVRGRLRSLGTPVKGQAYRIDRRLCWPPRSRFNRGCASRGLDQYLAGAPPASAALDAPKSMADVNSRRLTGFIVQSPRRIADDPRFTWRPSPCSRPVGWVALRLVVGCTRTRRRGTDGTAAHAGPLAAHFPKRIIGTAACSSCDPSPGADCRATGSLWAPVLHASRPGSPSSPPRRARRRCVHPPERRRTCPLTGAHGAVDGLWVPCERRCDRGARARRRRIRVRRPRLPSTHLLSRLRCSAVTRRLPRAIGVGPRLHTPRARSCSNRLNALRSALTDLSRSARALARPDRCRRGLRRIHREPNRPTLSQDACRRLLRCATRNSSRSHADAGRQPWRSVTRRVLGIAIASTGSRAPGDRTGAVKDCRPTVVGVRSTGCRAQRAAPSIGPFLLPSHRRGALAGGERRGAI